jgi:hypothetical protein
MNKSLSVADSIVKLEYDVSNFIDEVNCYNGLSKRSFDYYQQKLNSMCDKYKYLDNKITSSMFICQMTLNDKREQSYQKCKL